MACFRGTSVLSGLCKASRLCQVNTHSRRYSGLAKNSLLMSKNGISSSYLQVARYQSPFIPNCVSASENVLALCPTLLQSLTNSQTTVQKTAPTTRGFHSSASLRQNQPDEKPPTFGEQMSLRLINENGFLSWTRNSYLSAAVGATMLNGANVDVVQHAGILVLVVSAMNMAWGSACHFTNLIRIRNRCAMSRPTLLLNLLGCVVHALLWLFILGYYIHFSGYTGWIRRRRRHHPENAYTSFPSKEQ